MGKRNQMDELMAELRYLHMLLYLMQEVLADVKEQTGLVLAWGEQQEERDDTAQDLKEIYRTLDEIYESHLGYLDYTEMER